MMTILKVDDDGVGGRYLLFRFNFNTLDDPRLIIAGELCVYGGNESHQICLEFNVARRLRFPWWRMRNEPK